MQWQIQDFPDVEAPTYDFAKNCMKLKEFGLLGGRPKFYYVDLPLGWDGGGDRQGHASLLV